MAKIQRPEIHPKTRRGWRAWLARNHAKSDGVWLVFFRQATGRRRLSYNDAVEEALCFGWIDSVVQPISDERYMQLFTPRRRGSVWSKVNKTRVERVIAAGLMTPAGMAKIEAAQRDGSWASIDHVENLVIPPDLARVFTKSKRARATFDASSRSNRKVALYWLNNVKSPALRAKRLAALAAVLGAGQPLRPGMLSAYLKTQK
jgi:uncharacterized protein YdeI (YjbR/CyaY-like superfamily)